MSMAAFLAWPRAAVLSQARPLAFFGCSDTQMSDPPARIRAVLVPTAWWGGTHTGLTSRKKESMAKKKGGSDSRLVVVSAVKAHLACHDVRTAGDLDEALSKVVGDLLDKAVVRCKSNGRATVRGEDL